MIATRVELHYFRGLSVSYNWGVIEIGPSTLLSLESTKFERVVQSI